MRYLEERSPDTRRLAQPERVHRTGLVAYLERGAVCSIFNIQLDPALPAVYVERGTIAKLHGLLPRPN
jgi:hypothetical protein